MLTPAPNPYKRSGSWFFYDETGDEYGPFSSQAKATKELFRYCRWLERGPTLWQRVWWPVKRFLKGVFNG